MGSDLYMAYEESRPARAAIKRIIRVIKEDSVCPCPSSWHHDTSACKKCECRPVHDHSPLRDGIVTKEQLINFLEKEMKLWDGYYNPS